MRKRIFCSFLWATVLCISVSLKAQKTASYSTIQHDLQEGISLFDQGLYAASQPILMEVLTDIPTLASPSFEMLRSKALLYIAKAAVRMGKPEAESLVLDFVEKHQPDPIAVEAQMEIAHYYYNEQDFEQSIKYYEMINPSLLTKDQLAEAQFKKGYSYFVTQEFETAANIFSESKDLKTPYFYPTNYYYGLTQFFVNDYKAAIESFERVSKSEKYAQYVPYYIAQIYFSEKKYEEVINYGTKKIDQPKLQNKKEIQKLIGESYFELGKFTEALPYLEYYEKSSGSMRAEDFYQLGFVQYQSGKCEEAVKNFQELRNLDNEMSFQSHVYMADCYIKNGDLTSARTAFKFVSEKATDENLKNESLFNYAKLSAELNYDQAAIQTFQKLPNSSIYFDKGQKILKNIFLQTRDFENAISTLEALPSLSADLQEAYQKVTLSRAIQLINDTKIDDAQNVLDKSMKYTPNKNLHAQSLFWKGEIQHFKNDYKASAFVYDQYFSIANNIYDLPNESSPALANYNQGYNYLKQNNYSKASTFFTNSISKIQNNFELKKEGYIQNRILSDALLRNGDCLFKQNKYSEALQNYDQSITSKKSGYVYAMYQKAIINGLLNKKFEKISLLQEIIKNHPTDVFADDALLQLGLTYQESGENSLAIKSFNILVDVYDKDPALVNEALLQLGLISYNNGDATSALNYYKRIFDRNADPVTSREALTAIEEIYIHDLSKPDEYVKFVENLDGYNVSDFKKDSLTFIAANTKYENGVYDKAIENFSGYLTKFPNGLYQIEAIYNRGESQGILKNFNEALTDYELVIQKGQSEYYEKALKKASILNYNHTQNFNKALSYYQKWEQVASNEESRFEAQLGALRSAYRVHDQAIVIANAQKVINNSAASIDHISTAHFYKGKVHFDQKDMTEALEDFNQVSRLSNNENAAEARYLIAKIYFNKLEYDVAEQLCLNVNKESSNYPHWVVKSVLLLSDIYIATTDYFNARAALEAIMENYNGEDTQIKNEAQEKLNMLDQLEKSKSRINKAPQNPNQLEMIQNKDNDNDDDEN